MTTQRQQTLDEAQTLIHHGDIHSARQLHQFLQRCSPLSLLAEGKYATVYALPDEPDRILRVCADPEDGYPLFQQWCAQQPNNPHLPQCHNSIQLPLNLRQQAQLTTLERLNPISSRTEPPTAAEHFNAPEFGELWAVINTLIRRMERDQQTFCDLAPTLNHWLQHLHNAALPAELLQQHHTLLLTLFNLFTATAPLARLDLHGDNFMLRGDTVVILDPLARRYTLH